MIKRHDRANCHAAATVTKHHRKAKPPVLQLITDCRGILASIRKPVHGVRLAARDGEIGGLPFGEVCFNFLQRHKSVPPKNARRRG